MTGLRRVFTIITGALMGIVCIASAQAATLVISGGQLIGAKGVMVNSTSYNVEFLDGTCISLFEGCDANSDFDYNFTSPFTASSAAAALIAQVWLDGSSSGPEDDFDSNPALTRGCEDSSGCSAFIPYFTSSLGTTVSATLMFNSGVEANDGFPKLVTLAKTQDTSTHGRLTYARFSLDDPFDIATVPVPAALPLFGTGIAIMGFMGWRRKRRTTQNIT